VGATPTKLPLTLSILIFVAACLITASLIPQEPPWVAELRENDRYFNSRLSHVEKRVVDFSEPIAVNNARQEGRGE